MGFRAALMCVGALAAAVGFAAGAGAQVGVHTTGSGGVQARALEQGAGGGGVAPSDPAAAPSEAARAESSGGASAGAAQEETPTTPGGGEQPESDPDTPTSDDDPATPEPGEEPAPVEPNPGAEDIATDDGALGFLPSTGLEAAALAAIGFALLLGGIALRPRRYG